MFKNSSVIPPTAIKANMAIILPSPLVFLLSAGLTEALLILAHGRRGMGVEPISVKAKWCGLLSILQYFYTVQQQFHPKIKDYK
jgi:hypothetical protein